MPAHLDLVMMCKPYGIPKPIPEYKFMPDRKFRIDYAWPQYRLAVEIEGGVWVQGRHTRGFGFLNDMEKYNYLTLLGWSLLRFTPGMVNSGEAIETIKIWFKGKEV